MVMIIFRKAVSPVVATVLLLVLTIVIGGIVFSVVLPFVNDKLGESKACLDAFEGVEFPESKFNCYNISTTNETGFSVKLVKEGIASMKVALIDDRGNSDVFDLSSGMAPMSKLRMAGTTHGVYMTPLTFPTVGGQRTYIAREIYKKAEISAVTSSGDICSVADVIEFEPCYGVTL
jgi:flagellin-like protein